jgi:hypothetical protein
MNSVLWPQKYIATAELWNIGHKENPEYFLGSLPEQNFRLLHCHLHVSSSRIRIIRKKVEKFGISHKSK